MLLAARRVHSLSSQQAALFSQVGFSAMFVHCVPPIRVRVGIRVWVWVRVRVRVRVGVWVRPFAGLGNPRRPTCIARLPGG